MQRLLDDGFDVVNLDPQPPAGPTGPHERCVEVDLADEARTRAVLAQVAAERPVTRPVHHAGIARSGMTVGLAR